MSPYRDRPPTFSGYDSPRGGSSRGGSIADLIMYNGQQQANAALRSGDIWANVAHEVADIGVGALQQAGERKQKEQMAKRDAAWVAYVESGEWQKDPKAAYGMATRVWGPQEGPKQFAGLEAVQKIGAGKPEEDAKHLGQVIGAVGPLGDDAKARWWPQLRALGAHVFPDAQIPEQYDPAMWPEIDALGKQLRGEKPPELKTVTVPGPKGEPMLKSVTPDELAAGVPTYVAPKTTNVVTPGPGGPLTKSFTDDELRAGVPTYRDPKEPKEHYDLGAAGIDMAALNYKKTGTPPPIARDPETLKKIIDRAASLTPEDVKRIEAGGADIAGNKAAYGADASSLKKLQAQTDAVSAFESTASKNAQLLEDIAKRVPDLGASFLNRPIRALAGKLGSEDIAALNAIRQSTANEYSRIISNPNLTGTMSDSARHEGDSLLASGLTFGQLRAALKTLAAEAKNRHTSYSGQLKEIRGRIGGDGKARTGGPAKGERRTIQGKLAEWDGKGWMAVQ